MSNAVFPVMPGLQWDVKRTPVFGTTVTTAVSGREYRVANMPYPRYKYALSFAVLRQTPGYTELATLCGFFNARLGSFDSFLFADPEDNSVITQIIGTGDGSNKLFQLVRAFGSFIEPVYDVNAAPQISVNGALKTLTTDYTISATGLVTFVAAPGAALSVTWTGTFYRRVRFTQDMADFSKFMQALWELKTLEFISTKP